jgi:hypothetical protein
MARDGQASRYRIGRDLASVFFHAGTAELFASMSNEIERQENGISRKIFCLNLLTIPR